jgi:Na+/H+ antiporter NhaD/arsenite permease-like protein
VLILVGASVLVVGSAVLSGVIDNIPYVTTMAPVTADVVDGLIVTVVTIGICLPYLWLRYFV